MIVNKTDKSITIIASEGYKLTFRGSTESDFFNQITVPSHFNTEAIIEVVDSNIPVYVPEYKPELYNMTLDEIQQHIISKTKVLLVEFLDSNPLVFNGKTYSVTSTAQSHLASVIKCAEDAAMLGMQFTPTWAAAGEVREAYDLNTLKQLFVAIQNYVTPFVIQQQKMEEQILSCTDKETLLQMNIAYYKED